MLLMCPWTTVACTVGETIVPSVSTRSSLHNSHLKSHDASKWSAAVSWVSVDDHRSTGHPQTFFCTLQVEGELDTRALRYALEAVTAQQEMLRVSFDLQGEQPRQKIASMGDAGVRMEVQELQGSAAAAVEALGDSLTWSSQEVSRGPLLTLIIL